MDFRVQDFGRLILLLRRDLRFTPQSFATESCYVVEDPVNSKFYRVGLHEYTFLSLLDGRNSIADAIRLTTQALAGGGFSETEALAICRWLVDSGLAQTEASASTVRLSAAGHEHAARRWLAWNPLSMRIPFCHPDRFVARLAPAVTWLFSWPVVLAVCGLLIAAGYQVAAQWNRVLGASHEVFAAENWLWLTLSWIGLKLVHELAHAVVCKKYGGVVREAGVVCVLFAPIAYVDVTTSWRFRSKWQRIFTAAAGMYVELLIAAVAAIVWSRSSPGTLENVCFNVAAMASVTTLVFNANPLMRFDGYYIASDWLGIPNLASTGQQWLLSLARRGLLGLPDSTPLPAGWQGFVIRGYGVAALVWRVLVTIGLVIAAATFFHGAGLLLAAAAVAMWLGSPLWRFARYVVQGKPGERPRWGRAVAVSLSCGGGLAGLLLTVPWPGGTSAPAYVEFAPLTIVRADSNGFVRDIRVAPGRTVGAGDLLLVLENRELLADLAGLELQCEQSRVKARQFEQKSELASVQAERATQAALLKKIAEKRQQLDRLTVRAPVAGQVLGRGLSNLLNAHVKEGTELLSIGTDDRKELRLSVAQDDIETFSGRIGRPIRVRLPGLCGGELLTLDRIVPRATLEPPHASLCAPSGGPLPVRAKEKKSGSEGESFEFLAPRFLGYVSLDRSQSESLRAGQLGTISIRPFDESIGMHSYLVSTRWLRSQWNSRTSRAK